MALPYCQCSVFKSFINSLITFIEHEFCAKYLVCVAHGIVGVTFHLVENTEIKQAKRNTGSYGSSQQGGAERRGSRHPSSPLQVGRRHLGRESDVEQEGGLWAASRVPPAESEGRQLDISLSTMEEGGHEVKFLCVQLLKDLPNHVQPVSFIQQIGARHL